MDDHQHLHHHLLHVIHMVGIIIIMTDTAMAEVVDMTEEEETAEDGKKTKRLVGNCQTLCYEY